MIHGLLIIIVGTVLGSLLPDIDASDSAIMHGEIKVFGKFFKHMVYPIFLHLTKKFLGIEGKHRGIMHSLLGILLFDSILLPFTLLVTAFFVYYYNVILVGVYRLIFFFITLTLGAILHIVEVGFTVSGVFPFLPKKIKIARKLKPFTKGEKTFGSGLVFSLGIIFIYGYLTHDVFLTFTLDIVALNVAFVISQKYGFDRK